MKKIIEDEDYGTIIYEESFWLGRKSLTVNGSPLRKISKKQFELTDGSTVSICGNYYSGLSLLIGSKNITIMPKLKWYELVLCIMPFILNLVWGNVVALCEIVPIIGGAIGGAICGALSFVSLYLIRTVKPTWLKIIVAFAMLGASFGICCGVAYIYLAII